MVDDEYNPELEDGDASGLSPEAWRPRVRKAADAFRTISEVADELHVPQHVLRFWETKFLQVRPLKRGGGRRYYRPADVALLRRVADLLYTQGYTIKGVQRLLRDGATTPDAPRERNPAPAQAFLIPPEPQPHPELAAGWEPDLEAEQPDAPPFLETPVTGVDLPPIPDPSRPEQEVADTASAKEISRLRGLLAQALATLEDLRRAIE